MKFYISFGQEHCHRLNGKTLDCDSLLELEADDEFKAREWLNKAFNRRWSNIYSTKEYSNYFPRGVVTYFSL